MNMFFFNVWTVDSEIMFKKSDNEKPNVCYGYWRRATILAKKYGTNFSVSVK